MKLSKPMIQIFTEVVEGKDTLQKIASTLNKSVSWVSEVLTDLEAEGFVKKKQSYTLKESRIIIEIRDTSHANKLKDLIVEFSTINYEDILSNSKLLFLAALSEDWITLEHASTLSKVSLPMIKTYKLKLQNRGIIAKKGKLYKINEKAWPLLREFLLAYKNHSSTRGFLKWKFQDEMLCKVHDEKMIQGVTTGFYEYKKYGVLVGVISALCYLPKKKLSKEEIFVHSLFEVDDPRTLHLAVTFYLKNKLSYKKILPLAMRYGKYTMFENFVKLLKTKEKVIKLEGLPVFDRKDFMRIANMYEVKHVQ